MRYIKIKDKKVDEQKSEIENIANLWDVQDKIIKVYKGEPTMLDMMQHTEKDSKYQLLT